MSSRICVATLLWLSLPAVAQNVIYTATGTFAATVVRGRDTGKLAGQKFSIRIIANEALKPIKQTETSALYSGISFTSGFESSLLPEQPLAQSGDNLNLFVRLGAPGQPDMVKISFPTNSFAGPVTVEATLKLPPGTLTTTAIQPLPSPVALTPANIRFTYAQLPRYTTLEVANGTLDSTVGPQPGSQPLQVPALK